MKILQVVHSVPFLNQAGTEVYTYDLSLELSKRHEVYIFSRICDKRQKEYEITEQRINGITAYLLNNTFKYCDSFERYYQNDEIDRNFAELLDRIKPDVVHIQHLLFLSIGLIRKIKDRGMPIIFTLHDYWLMCPRWHILKRDLTPCEKVFAHNFDEECLSCIRDLLNIKKGAKRIYVFSRNLLPSFLVGWLKKVYFSYRQKMSDNDTGIDKLKKWKSKTKALLDEVGFFIAPSRYLRDRFVEFGIFPQKIRIVQNGLNGSLFTDTKKTKSNKIKFAFIGTILPAKGLHVLIESFNRIDRKDAELKIYGRLYPYIGFEYYLPSLKKMIKNKNIRLIGDFNHTEIPEIFKEIDVLIVPSIWCENAPIVIKEAFLSKTPVIASRIGGMAELVNDGINGLLFNPGDTRDLQEKIGHIINNPGIISRFSDNIPVVKSIEDNAKEIEGIYSTLFVSSKE